jgi:hypothetical protein
MKRRVPRLTTDEGAEAFLESDLSDLDFSQFKSGRLRSEEGSGSPKTRLPPAVSSSSPNSDYERSKKRAAQIDEPVPSETYRLFERAMIERKQIICVYKGGRREVCPIILGHSQGEEKALTYQFGGESRSGLPWGGNWRCMFLSHVSEVQFREGQWYSGDSHAQASRCVEVVDLDVNPNSPYKPKRRLPNVIVAEPARRDSQTAARRSPKT